MMRSTQRLDDCLRQLLANGEAACLVEVVEVRGSAPRDAGVFMIVSAQGIAGTIGGGALEWVAIDKAREGLRNAALPLEVAVPLGSEIGQCCGGHVRLRLTLADQPALQRIAATENRRAAMAPEILILGCGHVGYALALALAPLPFATSVIDTRPEALTGLPAGIRGHFTATPESFIVRARPQSGFVVLTHDHGLDFVLAHAALAREDASYVGMIGSRSKRAKFENWYRRQGNDRDGAAAAILGRLVCPVGGGDVADKRPEVIAALVAAELLQTCLGQLLTRSNGADAAAARQTEPCMGEK